MLIILIAIKTYMLFLVCVLISDLYDLQEACEQINEVTELINDRMKEHDRRIKVTMVEKRFIDLVDAIGHFVKPSRIFIAESSEHPSNEEYIVRHDKFGNQIPITVFLFNDCLIYGYYEHNRRSVVSVEDGQAKELRKGKLRFGSILVFDELFHIEDVPFDDDYNYKKISCLKLQARHHAMWISFHSYTAKLKWFDMVTKQNEKLSSQNLNARRRSAFKKNWTSSNGGSLTSNGTSTSSTAKYNKQQNRDELYLPIPVFVPDDYSDICMDCKTKFGVISRRHHCYFCGKLCCKKCTKWRLVDIWKLHFEQKKEYVRVCEFCKTEREEYLDAKQNKYQLNYYTNDNLNGFGSNSSNFAHQLIMENAAKNNYKNNNKPTNIVIEEVNDENVNNMNMNNNGMDNNDCESENEQKLISPSTFDITKSHLMDNSRVSKRRAQMNKQKSMEPQRDDDASKI